MSQNEFLEKMVDIIDSEKELTINMNLNDLEEWDSLSILTFLAEMEKYAKAPINVDLVKKAETLEDLYKLIG